MREEFWNARYSSAEYVYGTAPNAFFAAELAKLQPGRILLPAEGEGRNAVHAAREGWEVFAFDQSSAGQAKALQLAAKHHVDIEYVVSDCETITLDAQMFDAAALMFAHFSPEWRTSCHRKIVEALKPGGTVILEAFSKDQLGKDSGGPPVLAMLYSCEELQHDFDQLDVVELTLVQTDLSEGTYHSGEASVIRMVASK